MLDAPAITGYFIFIDISPLRCQRHSDACRHCHGCLRRRRRHAMPPAPLPLASLLVSIISIGQPPPFSRCAIARDAAATASAVRLQLSPRRCHFAAAEHASLPSFRQRCRRIYFRFAARAPHCFQLMRLRFRDYRYAISAAIYFSYCLFSSAIALRRLMPPPPAFTSHCRHFIAALRR